jgi:hypothetical protein
MLYIREALTDEKDHTFKAPKTAPHHYQDPATIHNHSDCNDDTGQKRATSPAIEALIFSHVNKNGMGDE